MTGVPSVELLAEPLEDTSLLRFEHLAAIEGFSHAVTTRPWNMAPHRGPQADRAGQRRRQVCARLGLPFESLTAPDQVHSPHVLCVSPSDVGAGRDGKETAIRFCDGLICGLPDVPIMLFSADCPLILAVEPARRVFGTAHASWRGTVTHIAEEMVLQMRRHFGIDPANLSVGISPCAGPGDYEIGDDVRRIIIARITDGERFLRPKGNRWRLDLREANAAQLVSVGVDPAKIAVACCSTMTDPRFFSHRRDGPDTGRFALIAGFRTV